VRIVVRTTAPRWLFERTVRRAHSVTYQHVECDTGVVQIDSLHPDVDATLQQTRDFMRTFDARVAVEAAVLLQERADLVVADLPALGIAAGCAAAVPTVGLGNFTWDWIYGDYPDSQDIVDAIGEAYRGARLALRLPMHGGFATFAEVVDLPFVARCSMRDPMEIRRGLGLPLDERLVLVSFGGYGLGELDLDALSRISGFAIVMSADRPLGELPEPLRNGRRGSLLPFDERAMYTAGFFYEDLVRAVDVVVTKPGYGIIAECVANDTAMLYTSRGHFIEYDTLVAALPRLLRSRFIDHAALFAGEWQPHLDSLVAQARPPETPPVNGAEIAAGVLGGFL
jgi:hypothetical protein